MMRWLSSWFKSKFDRIQPAGGLAERTVKSGIWAAIINVSDRALSMVMLVVVARYLAPDDFGLMGIALLSVAVMDRLTKLGFDTALIQRKASNVDDFMNTVWTLKVVRGLVIAFAVYFSAPFVAEFFGETRATEVIRVISVAPLISGVRNPKIVYLQKNLEFHRQFVYRTLGTLTQVTIAIGLAIVLGNVWALVFGVLGGRTVRTASSYFILPYLPWPEIKRKHASELIEFGKWITGLNAVGFVFSQGDDAFVGWYLGAASLGIYQMAYRLGRAPSTEVTQVVSGIMLPAYSKIQDDLDKLRTTYFKVLKLVTFVSAPAAAGIIAVAQIFVETFMGANWLPMVPVMQILAIWGFVLSVGACSGPLLQAIGRPDYNTKASSMKLVALAVLIYPASATYGLVGTTLAVLGSALLTSEPYINYCVLDELDASARSFLRAVSVPLIPSLIMGGTVLALQSVLPVRSSPLHFALLVLSGIAIYAILITVADSKLDYGMKEILRSMTEFS